MSDSEAAELIERTDQVLKTLETAEIKRLNQALDAAYLSLEKELLKKYPKYSAQAQPGLLATQRGLLLANDLSQVLQLINPDREVQITKRLEKLLATASKTGVTLADELVQLIEGDSFVKGTAALPIEAAAFAARDAVKRLKKHDAKFQEAASILISQGLIQGWGASRLASQIRSQLGVTKGRAEAIARTETMAALNDATQWRYQESGIDHVQLLTAAGDVCPWCVARDGNVYEVGKIRVPLHPRCRCCLMPYKKEWATLGLTNDKFIEKHKSDRLKELKAQGKEPNSGLSPFERAAGLEKPPEAVWQPGRRVQSGRLKELEKAVLQLEPLTSEYNAKLKEYVDEKNRLRLASQQTHQIYIAKGRQTFESSGVADLLQARQAEYEQADRHQKRTITFEMRALMKTWRQVMIAASPITEADAAQLVSRLKIENEGENIYGEKYRETLVPKDMAEFFRLTQGKGSRSLKRIFTDPKQSRAYASDSDNSINISARYSPSVLLHELGHHLEFEDRKLLKAAKNWINSRATGPMQSMNRLARSKSYREDEVAYPDKFIDPYIGKHYLDATEVISMGLEHFYNGESMLELYRKDPEHFYFMLGALL